MKYNPKYIILTTIYRYMDEPAIEDLKKDLAKISPRSHKKFLELIRKHFDINILRTKPLIPEDVYIYNYLTFELTSNFYRTVRFKRSGLIARYEKFFIPNNNMFWNEVKKVTESKSLWKKRQKNLNNLQIILDTRQKIPKSSKILRVEKN